MEAVSADTRFLPEWVELPASRIPPAACASAPLLATVLIQEPQTWVVTPAPHSGYCFRPVQEPQTPGW